MTAILPTSCNSIAKKASKAMASETMETVVRKVSKEAVEEAVEKSATKSIRKEGLEIIEYLTKKNPTAKTLVDRLAKAGDGKMLDKLILEAGEDGEMILRHADWPNSRAVLKGNSIITKGGSVANAADQSLNELLNHLVPNARYVVDDNFSYLTDKLGRQSNVTAVLRKSDHIERCKLGTDFGKSSRGAGDAGHLVQRSLGGPNESLNLVPMGKELNEHGIWRKLEIIESKLVNEGKTVIKNIEVIYDGASEIPSKFRVSYIVDGKKTPFKVDGKFIDFPVEIDNIF